MSAPADLLHFEQAVEAVRAVVGRGTDRDALRRAVHGLSYVQILSIVVLADQLDGIAQAAARHLDRSTDMDAWEQLQELLLLSGYLPRSASPSPPTPNPEASHGEG